MRNVNDEVLYYLFMDRFNKKLIKILIYSEFFEDTGYVFPIEFQTQFMISSLTK